MKKQEALELVDVVAEENKKEEPLMLDTLAENEVTIPVTWLGTEVTLHILRSLIYYVCDFFENFLHILRFYIMF